MNLYYRRESWINDKTIYRMITFRLRQNRSMKGNKLPEENPYEIGTGDTVIGLDFLKRRYKKMNQREKRMIEKNLVFASRNKGLERREGKTVLKPPEDLQVFTDMEEDSVDELDESQQTQEKQARTLTIQDFDEVINNRYIKRASNLLEIYIREIAREKDQPETEN